MCTKYVEWVHSTVSVICIAPPANSRPSGFVNLRILQIAWILFWERNCWGRLWTLPVTLWEIMLEASTFQPWMADGKNRSAGSGRLTNFDGTACVVSLRLYEVDENSFVTGGLSGCYPFCRACKVSWLSFPISRAWTQFQGVTVTHPTTYQLYERPLPVTHCKVGFIGVCSVTYTIALCLHISNSAIPC